MHSFTAPSGRTYFHNGDFSGDVQFEAAPGYGVGIPFADLKALVAEYVRQGRISALESLADVEILAQHESDTLLGLTEE